MTKRSHQSLTEGSGKTANPNPNPNPIPITSSNNNNNSSKKKRERENPNTSSDKSDEKKTENKSQKRLRINQSLTSKLHVLTNTEEREFLAPLPGLKTGAKNENIWDFKNVISDNEISYLKVGDFTVSDTTAVIPAVESLRHRCVAKSRDHLKKLCKDEGVIPPLMAWERWQSNCLLKQLLQQNTSDSDYNVSGGSGSSSGGISGGSGNSSSGSSAGASSSGSSSASTRSHIIFDLILPSQGDEADDGLERDLQRGEITEKNKG
jgi:hypothetical protein